MKKLQTLDRVFQHLEEAVRLRGQVVTLNSRGEEQGGSQRGSEPGPPGHCRDGSLACSGLTVNAHRQDEELTFPLDLGSVSV